MWWYRRWIRHRRLRIDLTHAWPAVLLHLCIVKISMNTITRWQRVRSMKTWRQEMRESRGSSEKSVDVGASKSLRSLPSRWVSTLKGSTSTCLATMSSHQSTYAFSKALTLKSAAREKKYAPIVGMYGNTRSTIPQTSHWSIGTNNLTLSVSPIGRLRWLALPSLLE